MNIGTCFWVIIDYLADLWPTDLEFSHHLGLGTNS